MEPFKTHTGLVATMDRSNVDTDQIIPKQFLKRIERTGFGEFLFFDWRYKEDETLNSQFELNQPQFSGAPCWLPASILAMAPVANMRFGRWQIMDSKR